MNTPYINTFRPIVVLVFFVIVSASKISAQITIECNSAYTLDELTAIHTMPLSGGNYRGVSFNPDGTRMYIATGDTSSSVETYELSTPWDLSTVSATPIAVYDQPALTDQPTKVLFNSDGSKMFVSRRGSTNTTNPLGTDIWVYDLAPGNEFLPSNGSVTAQPSQNLIVSGPVMNVRNFAFNNDGTRLFVSDVLRNMRQYDLSTPFDLSTISNQVDYKAETSVNDDEQMADFVFNDDGTALYVSTLPIGTVQNTIFEYTLSTPFSLSPAPVQNEDQYTETLVGTSIRSMAWSNGGGGLFLADTGNDTITQYGASTNDYVEDSSSNDGTVSSNANRFFVIGDTFLDANNDDILDGGFTVTNLPQGLTASFVLTLDDTVAELILTGLATEHNDTDSVQINVEFDSGAITSGGTLTNNCTGSIGITFLPQTGPQDDYDGDGILNVDDLDDDNDGIPDIVECPLPSGMVTPQIANEQHRFGSNSAMNLLTGQEPEFGGNVDFDDVLNTPQTTINAGIRYFGATNRSTTFFNFFTFPNGSVIRGIALWNPEYSPMGAPTHSDEGIREFTITVDHDGGQTTVGPYIAEADPTVQFFDFGQTFSGITRVRMTVLNGWEDIGNTGNLTVTPTPTPTVPDYNMTLFEVRFFDTIVPTDIDGDGIANHFDLDSDGDGCPDALEGDGAFTPSDLIYTDLPGGNTGTGYTGTSTDAIHHNFGNNVHTSGPNIGLPIAVGTQGLGNSQDGALQDAECATYSPNPFVAKQYMRHGKYFINGVRQSMEFGRGN